MILWLKSNGEVVANMTEAKEVREKEDEVVCVMVFSGSGSPLGFLRERRMGRTTMNATMIHGLKIENLLIFLMMKNKRKEVGKRRLVWEVIELVGIVTEWFVC